ncbi:Dolichyl-phosphate beta-glucosyltransferase [Zalerion maritima]|uniref:dolichyl-phosphate beta-glucosyltransferase n=1 Tax=Zalerion maritima TaxID=339359 RepID=A0AAD5RH10_9PEZI|nr:Dolichyl-phosphate beta-glucosyltransferase [Zalerion maritima]
MTLIGRALALPEQVLWPIYLIIKTTPFYILFPLFVVFCLVAFLVLYVFLHHIAPKPRLPFPSEKTYVTTTPDGGQATRQLPCWYDRWLAERKKLELAKGFDITDTGVVEPAEVAMSVVVPAYNEEERITSMLEEAVQYLDEAFGRPETKNGLLSPRTGHSTPVVVVVQGGSEKLVPSSPVSRGRSPEGTSGYEIIIVNDGSKDRTVEVALEFAEKNNLHDIVRVITLEKNRGKGGGVAHGLRHVRGEYVVFADADGASKFSDLGNLLEGLEEVVDGSHRGVAIGSRAHMVESEAVVKRSALRNFLMRSFHLVLTILTPPATSRIRDTQCGFKLFSRAALPHIVPYMHVEGWIFDIEMLMLAESAPDSPILGTGGVVIGQSPGIKVAEVPIHWHEVGGSKAKDDLRKSMGRGWRWMRVMSIEDEE